MAQRTATLILVILLLFQIITLMAWLPLSAEAGQTSVPWMMTRGQVLYGDILTPQKPGPALITAGILAALRGVTPFAVAQMLNTIMIGTISLLLYAVARRLTAGSLGAGIAAALIWALWAPIYAGSLLHPGVLLALCVLIGLVLWLHTGPVPYDPARVRRWPVPLLVGLFFGAATLMSPVGWLAVIIFGLFLLLTRQSARDIGLYVLGAEILPVMVVVVVAAQGNLPDYLYWTWIYPISEAGIGALPDTVLLYTLLLSNALVLPYALLTERERRPGPYRLIFGLWLALVLLALLRFDAGAAHAAFAALMSGIVIALAWPRQQLWRYWRNATPADVVLTGLGGVLLAGWLAVGASAYIPTSLGIGATPGVDDYRTLAGQVRTLSAPGNTLFVLPTTESTAQLHPMTRMLAPGLWLPAAGDGTLAPADTADRLLAEWAQTPPTFIVIFPELLSEDDPGTLALLDFITARYDDIGGVMDSSDHGPAEIWRQRVEG